MNISTSLIVTASLIIFGGFFSRWQKTDPDLDQQVLDQLKKAGSDLSKPHNIEFFLYFKNEEAASRAAKEVQKDVDNAKVQRAANDSGWLCFATKRMAPDHEELVRLRKRFNSIASEFEGEYDGWGTEVVK
jgi:regulator of RNase E activity RraB